MIMIYIPQELALLLAP